MSALRIRRAQPEDGEAVAQMCRRLADADGAPVPAFSAEHFRADGFGPEAAFTCLVAERSGAVVGYALFHRDYDTDRMERSVYVAGLYVEEAARHAGIGARLLAGVARTGRYDEARLLCWNLDRRNVAARRFYAAMGAGEQSGAVWCAAYEAHFSALAEQLPSPDIRLRDAAIADAPLVADFMDRLQIDLGGDPHPHARARVERDGHSTPAFFQTIFARNGAAALGFAVHWPTYDTGLGCRGLLISDLYVVPAARGRGVATALIGELARRARAIGGSFLVWPVPETNRAARARCARIAVEYPETFYCTLEGEAFQRLLALAP